MGIKYLETLMLHHPTRATELLELVPKPQGAVPRDGLPVWDSLPVGAKLPMMPGVGTNVVFCRANLGEKLWRSFKGQDFLLYDPYCRQVQYEYEPMHDQHLVEFFRRPVNRQRVRDAGLLTADGDGAICTLRQYNMYRQYLHRLHMDAVDKERELWDTADRGRSVLRQAQTLASRDCERAVARKLYVMKTAGRRAEQEAMVQAKRDACVARMRRDDDRVEQLRQQHDLWLRTLPGRVRALDERIRAHCTVAQERESRRVAAVLRTRRDKDEQLRERLRRRLEDRMLKKKMREEHRWKIKFWAQTKRMDRETRLLYDYHCLEEKRVAWHQQMMEEEWAYMNEMLKKIKKERMAKLKGEKPPDLVKAITKALEDTQKSSGNAQSPWVLGKIVRASLAEKKPGDITGVLLGVKKKLEKASLLPEQVLFTLDALLEGVIKEFVLKGLAAMMSMTIEKAIELVRIKTRDPHSMEEKHHHAKPRRRSSETERSYSKISVRSLSRNSQDKEKSDSLLQLYRGVSFGNATTIGRSSLVDVKGPLRSSRDRPPTPVPSLDHLAQEVFNVPQEEEEEVEDEDEGEIKGKPDYHKLKLERQFAGLSKRLIKSVVHKIDAADLRRKIMKPPLPDFKKYHVINKLAERILEDESRIKVQSEEFQDAVNILIQEVIKLYQQQESRTNK